MLPVSGTATDPPPDSSVRNVEQGAQVSLECIKPAEALTIEWSREYDLDLPSQSYFEGDMLVIPRIKFEDDGTYYCTAVYPGGIRLPSSTKLNVLGERKRCHTVVS